MPPALPAGRPSSSRSSSSASSRSNAVESPGVRKLGGARRVRRHVVVVAGRPVDQRPERLAEQALDAVALDRTTDPAPDRDAEPDRRPRARRPARRFRAETRRGPDAGSRPSGPGGRPGRSRRCATGADACGVAPRGRSTERPRSDGQPRAPLLATALDREPAGTRPHPGTKAVRAGALALFGWYVRFIALVATSSGHASLAGAVSIKSRPPALCAERFARRIFRPRTFSTRISEMRPGRRRGQPVRAPCRRCRIAPPRQSGALVAGAPILARFTALGDGVDPTMHSRTTSGEIWAAFRTAAAQVPDDVYRIWLEPLRAVALAERHPLRRGTERRRATGCGDGSARRSHALASLDRSVAGVEIVGEARDAAQRPRRLRSTPRAEPDTPFDDFVIGAGNRFAHAAALAVAELPARPTTRSFSTGPPASARPTAPGDRQLHRRSTTRRSRPSTRPLRPSPATSRPRSGPARSTPSRHRTAKRRAPARRRPIPREQAKDRRGVLPHVRRAARPRRPDRATADRPPAAMPALDAGLRDASSRPRRRPRPTRFRDPARDHPQARRRGLSSRRPADALELLARQVSSNIHALEGALIRVRAYASLTATELTTDVVEHVLSNL